MKIFLKGLKELLEALAALLAIIEILKGWSHPPPWVDYKILDFTRSLKWILFLT